MKKIFYFLSALALMAGFTACEEKEEGGIDFSEIVLDGFYVYGDATGSDKVVAANAMSAGNNEAVEGKPVRPGMYEKYIWLEADKDFALIMNSAGNMTFYGATLTEVNYGYDENDPTCKNFENNPNMKIQQGALVIGEDAPKMRVKETGLYHIVLDNNTDAVKIPTGAQIIVQKADWGVRGAMTSSWDYIKGEMTKNADGSITYTWVDQDMPKGGEFKFASCNGWKINLDVDGTVKAEVSLGVKDGKLSHVGANIPVGEKAGLYNITLTYTPKAGAIGDSFSYTTELTQESSVPTECYLTGASFGAWFGGDKENPSPYPTVAFNAVPGAPGHFWAVRYHEAGKEFKLSTKEEWSGELTALKYADGSAVGNSNLKFETSGLYIVYVDLVNYVLYMEEASIYGMGDAFGGWTADVAENKYNVSADGKVSVTTSAAGNMRTYVKAPSSLTEHTDWWKREFVVNEGKIEYRGGSSSDPVAVALTAGQTVTLDFNAGTGSIN